MADDAAVETQWTCGIWPENGRPYLFENGVARFMASSETTGRAMAALLQENARTIEGLRGQLERTQGWLEKWQGTAARLGLENALLQAALEQIGEQLQRIHDVGGNHGRPCVLCAVGMLAARALSEAQKSAPSTTDGALERGDPAGKET